MSTSKISFKGEIMSRDNSSITIEGLNPQELDLIKGLLQGKLWATVEEGRLQHRWNLTDLPEQILDDDMLPFWRRTTQVELTGEIQYELKKDFELPAGSVPSVIISHLCGYGYSKENYIAQASRLLNYGFIEMRSRRCEGGRYWEQWYLSGEWSAQGALKEYIDAGKHLDLKERTDRIVRFLCRNCSFGTLDLAWQRTAATID